MGYASMGVVAIVQAAARRRRNFELSQYSHSFLGLGASNRVIPELVEKTHLWCGLKRQERPRKARNSDCSRDLRGKVAIGREESKEQLRNAGG